MSGDAYLLFPSRALTDESRDVVDDGGSDHEESQSECGHHHLCFLSVASNVVEEHTSR